MYIYIYRYASCIRVLDPGIAHDPVDVMLELLLFSCMSLLTLQAIEDEDNDADEDKGEYVVHIENADAIAGVDEPKAEDEDAGGDEDADVGSLLGTQ